jgi:hypothetical protein
MVGDTIMDDKKGFLQDAQGDLSSGRLVKVSSFFAAIAFAVIGLAMIYVSKDSAIAGEISKYALATSGMFLGVATSAELVQKIKGL